MIKVYEPLLLRLNHDIGLDFDVWHGVPLAMKCDYNMETEDLPVLTDLADSVEIRTLLTFDESAASDMSDLETMEAYKRLKLRIYQ